MSEEEIIVAHQQSPFVRTFFTIYIYVVHYLVEYGWRTLGGCIMGLIIWNWMQPRLEAWKRAREDAAYHKDPDRVLAREEAMRKAREAQQQKLLENAQRAAELAAEREEKKRREKAEMLEKYGAATLACGGHRLGSDDSFMPLSGGASVSSYRAPKRSACGGGGCGR